MKDSKRRLSIIFLMFLIASCKASEIRIVDNSFPLKQDWSYETAAYVFEYSVGDGWVVIGSTDGLTALDAANGKILWEIDFILGGGMENLAIFEDKLVAIQGDFAKVFTINGEEVATIEFKTNMRAGEAQIAAISDKYVFIIRTTDWILETYDLGSGEFLWKAPAARGGADVYFDEDLNRAYIINVDNISAYEVVNGVLAWKLTGYFRASTYQARMLYFQEVRDNGNGYLTAYNLDTDNEYWSVPFNREIKKLSVSTDMVVASTKSAIISFDSAQGNLLWQHDTPNDEFSTAVIRVGDQLFAKGALSHNILAISMDGQLIGTLEVGSPVSVIQTYESYTANIQNSGSFLIFSAGNTVYAYNK